MKKTKDFIKNTIQFYDVLLKEKSPNGKNPSFYLRKWHPDNSSLNVYISYKEDGKQYDRLLLKIDLVDDMISIDQEPELIKFIQDELESLDLIILRE